MKLYTESAPTFIHPLAGSPPSPTKRFVLLLNLKSDAVAALVHLPAVKSSPDSILMVTAQVLKLGSMETFTVETSVPYLGDSSTIVA
jgi:hypothetical protein